MLRASPRLSSGISWVAERSFNSTLRHFAINSGAVISEPDGIKKNAVETTLNVE